MKHLTTIRNIEGTIGLTLSLGLSLVAGVVVAAGASAEADTGSASVSSVASEAISANSSQEYADGQEYAEGVVDIKLGDPTVVEGDGVVVDENTVNITAAGVYSLSGTLRSGSVNVDTEGKVYIEFDGVDIVGDEGPALYVSNAKKVTITLVQGTTNSLADATGAEDSDAALFSNDTLIINGGGTLLVKGNNKEGISSDDDIIVNAGTIKVTAADDGLNAHDDITVNGGDVYVLADGDGLDSNGTITLNGGTVSSFGGIAEGEGGMDAVGALTVTGGLILSGGGSMALPGSDSTQPSIYVDTGSSHAAGSLVAVREDGEEVLTFSTAGDFTSLLVSSGKLHAGTTYQVVVSDMSSVISAVAARVPVGGGVVSGNAGAVSGNAGEVN